MEKLTKKDLISAIAENSVLTKKDITLVVDETLCGIINVLTEGKTVDLGGFGKFEVSERSARTGINPATGEKIEIAASKGVKFKAAKAFKEKINQ